jgi:hypothetical protein
LYVGGLLGFKSERERERERERSVSNLYKLIMCYAKREPRTRPNT